MYASPLAGQVEGATVAPTVQTAGSAATAAAYAVSAAAEAAARQEETARHDEQLAAACGGTAVRVYQEVKNLPNGPERNAAIDSNAIIQREWEAEQAREKEERESSSPDRAAGAGNSSIAKGIAVLQGLGYDSIDSDSNW